MRLSASPGHEDISKALTGLLKGLVPSEEISIEQILQLCKSFSSSVGVHVDTLSYKRNSTFSLVDALRYVKSRRDSLLGFSHSGKIRRKEKKNGGQSPESDDDKERAWSHGLRERGCSKRKIIEERIEKKSKETTRGDRPVIRIVNRRKIRLKVTREHEWTEVRKSGEELPVICFNEVNFTGGGDLDASESLVYVKRLTQYEEAKGWESQSDVLIKFVRGFAMRWYLQVANKIKNPEEFEEKLVLNFQSRANMRRRIKG